MQGKHPISVNDVGRITINLPNARVRVSESEILVERDGEEHKRTPVEEHETVEVNLDLNEVGFRRFDEEDLVRSGRMDLRDEVDIPTRGEGQ